jgi:hypothetical protein
MSRFGIQLSIVAMVLVISGCRQADGDMPAPTGEQPNKISDIGRDLQNVAGGAADAERDLQDDLDGLDSRSKPEPLVRDLSLSLASALKGKSVSEAQAQNMAKTLFVVVTGRDLSSRQIERTSSELRTAVMNAGADGAAADKAAAAASTLSAQITQNRRRWYHVF